MRVPLGTGRAELVAHCALLATYASSKTGPGKVCAAMGSEKLGCWIAVYCLRRGSAGVVIAPGHLAHVLGCVPAAIKWNGGEAKVGNPGFMGPHGHALRAPCSGPLR